MPVLFLAAAAAGCGPRSVPNARAYYPAQVEARVYTFTLTDIDGIKRQDGTIRYDIESIQEPTPELRAFAVRGKTSSSIRTLCVPAILESQARSGVPLDNVVQRTDTVETRGPSAYSSSMPLKWLDDPAEMAMFWAKDLMASGLLGNRLGKDIFMFSRFEVTSWREQATIPPTLIVNGDFLFGTDRIGRYAFVFERGRSLVGIRIELRDGRRIEIKISQFIRPDPDM